jgi:C_GCAxxG_C_C family probable redox protein
MDREELIRRVEGVHEKYVHGLNCSERVFLTLHEILKPDIPSEAVAMLSGFGGGLAGTRDGVCGAVSGGIAAIGLLHGRRRPPEGSRERAYEVSREFVCRFKTMFGTTVCRELIGDLLREGTAEADGRRRERCYRYSLNAAKMCAEILSRYERTYASE